MSYKSVNQIYFSATGTTKKIVEEIGKHFTAKTTVYDLLRNTITEDIMCNDDNVAIVGMPVFSGRIPAICQESLAHLKGTNTPAIVVVVYGNRAYDDALLELKTIMETNGFVVIGAAAFVAEHSIFSRVAKGRPDAADMQLVNNFAKTCADKLATATTKQWPSIQVKGNTPYVEPKKGALKPSTDSNCNLCGACVAICPTQAIPKEDPTKKDANRCIACAACIKVCKQHAQAFRGPDFEAFEKMFVEKFSTRNEPEIFI